MRLKFNLLCVQVGIREITVGDISSEYTTSSVSKVNILPTKARVQRFGVGGAYAEQYSLCGDISAEGSRMCIIHSSSFHTHPCEG